MIESTNVNKRVREKRSLEERGKKKPLMKAKMKKKK